MAFHTLGCKLNFAETSSIGQSLFKAGFTKAGENEPADVCIINTCTVTDMADRKCRQAIHQMIRKNPDAFVIVTGCYAQLKPEEVAKLDGVALVLGAKEKFDIDLYLRSINHKDAAKIVHTHTNQIKKFAPSCSSDDRTRHFLKIQDGCDYYCTYCTIPFARGKSRSGNIAETVAEAQKVSAQGGKEIVITGVNLGDFGHGTDENFFDLIRQLDNIEGIERYRISSIEPNLLTDEIIDFVSHSKRFAPHFHIPLQSGCDEVLKLMRRRYLTDLFRHKIETIKKQIPDAFIGVDVIVGTRGETPEFFEASRQFINSLDITQLHVFTYSERAGTKALEIDYIVDEAEKKRRSEVLHELSDQKLRAFYRAHIGKTAKVLWETARKGNNMHGFTENYIRVSVSYNAALTNTIQNVKLGDFSDDDMLSLTCQPL